MGLAAVTLGRALARRAPCRWRSPFRSRCWWRSRAARSTRLMISRLGFPPLIVTLGTYSLFRGAAEGLTRGIENYSGLPPRIPVPRPGLRRRLPADAALRARRGDPRLRLVAAAHGPRPQPLRDRLLARRRALRGHARRAADRASLYVLSGLVVGPRRDRLRGAPRAGEGGRRNRLRADGDHRGRARRRVDLRRTRHGARDGAGPLRDRDPAERAATERRARGAGRHPDGYTARRHDPARPPVEGIRERSGHHRRTRGGRGEELTSRRPERRDPERGAAGGRRQLARGALAPAGAARAGRSRRDRSAARPRASTSPSSP